MLLQVSLIFLSVTPYKIHLAKETTFCLVPPEAAILKVVNGAVIWGAVCISVLPWLPLRDQLEGRPRHTWGRSKMILAKRQKVII